ncbi:acid phosphatase-domain-containing protein [Russula brevipes]|nr:acid phosphatase-domain-containing protein [Russula brevipes]
MPRPFPKIVALDTDWTIWEGFLDHKKWGKGPGRVTPIQNNIERVDDRLLRDKTNHDNRIRVYDDISKVVHDILKNGAQLAIVSRNPSKALCDRALYYFKTTDPKGDERSIIHKASYDEVVDEYTVRHFKRIHGWSEVGYSDMVLFDNQAHHNCVRIELGVTFQFLRNKKGLTWEAYQRGIETWRRAKSIRIVSNPSVRASRKVVIGFSGLATDWIERIQMGTGTVDTNENYRWGYALYVGHSLKVARHYCKQLNEKKKKRKGAKDAYVCAIWVKDYEAWKRIRKIWVPESNSYLPRMNSKEWSAFDSGRNQENRDRVIAERYGVDTPYVLFCRHHWEPDLRKAHGLRYNEMVVYTQIQRALFGVTRLSDKKVNRIANDAPYPFHCQINNWSITVPDETRREVRNLNDANVFRWLG